MKNVEEIMELVDNRRCFVCGPDNEHGLRVSFIHTAGKLTTNFKTEEWMQGYANIVHGGVITTLLDEAMVKLLFLEGINAVSAELHVKLSKAVVPGQVLHIESRIVAHKSRLIKTEAKATLTDGTPIASAEATCIKVSV